MANRRQVLLGLALALGGPTTLAGCDPGAGEDDILRSIGPDGPLKFYARRTYRLVGLLADAIIPRTDTPGALDAGVPAYLDAMMAAWASPQTKREHRDALGDIRTRLRAIGGRELAQLPDAERRASVAALDAAAYAEDEQDTDGVLAKYRAVKSLIATVYYATEIGATQELHYELVPGRWLSDAPLAEIGRTWAE